MHYTRPCRIQKHEYHRTDGKCRSKVGLSQYEREYHQQDAEDRRQPTPKMLDMADIERQVLALYGCENLEALGEVRESKYASYRAACSK